MQMDLYINNYIYRYKGKVQEPLHILSCYMDSMIWNCRNLPKQCSSTAPSFPPVKLPSLYSDEGPKD